MMIRMLEEKTQQSGQRIVNRAARWNGVRNERLFRFFVSYAREEAKRLISDEDVAELRNRMSDAGKSTLRRLS